MNIIYLQCDMRYNKWLLEKIDGKYVIQHTIERCMKIGKKERPNIIAGIYSCPENCELVNVLNDMNVKTIVSDEEDVNRRFLDLVVKEQGDYIVRIGGDQCLIDSNIITNILGTMKENGMEWFYENYINCILPDIVSVTCLKSWEKELRNADRYFKVLDKHKDIKRYRLPYPMLSLFNFRANSNESFRLCSVAITRNLSVYELSQRLQSRLINSEYLVKTGLLGSWIIPPDMEEFYYDENKEVNPWWGRSMVDLIRKHLNKSLNVFEWGAGNSTLFWSQHVNEVVSVEHDKQWYEKMQGVVPGNVSLKYHELGGVLPLNFR